ncbi:MAG: formylglycine-generating enzyme family protein [Planctomycetaceae bacterium]|jgi:formylglycine-generating enzyme required for sulfatase activity|nr:formylglycine-generating enzyme family protein [Planctomycetaceae bacterium]
MTNWYYCDGKVAERMGMANNNLLKYPSKNNSSSIFLNRRKTPPFIALPRAFYYFTDTKRLRCFSIAILAAMIFLSAQGMNQAMAQKQQDSPSVPHKAGDKKELTIKGIKYVFRWCPAGTFMMGSPSGEEGRDYKRSYDKSYDEVQHEVTLTKGFWLGEAEVTQEQWKAVMGRNPSHRKGMGANRPVERVSWEDCQAFVARLNELDVAPSGYKFSLPTEAQWEYACRAGTTGPYAGDLDAMAWCKLIGGTAPREVGTKQSNAWGFYDMQGNVSEWCQDWYGNYPTGNITDPTGAASGARRVNRGGSDAISCRSAARSSNPPGYRDNYLGCRLSFTDSDFGKKTNVDTLSTQTSAQPTISTNQLVTDQPVENGLKAGEVKELTIKGMKWRFRYCPAGTFTMGSPFDEKGRGDNEVQREVTLTKGFYMGETEVTQEQWEAVMGRNPSIFNKGANLPVEGVSCDDCQKFVAKLNELDVAPSGYKFALPTEAQWEYACRAGTTGPYAGDLDAMAWREKTTHPVGTKQPNAYGFYDMHGNVSEWCKDWYGDYWSGKVTDPTGPSSGTYRVFRGAGDSRSARREFGNPDSRGCGCRLSLLPIAVQPFESGSAATLKAGEMKELTIKDVKWRFRYCPAGTFTMGSPSDEEGRFDGEVQHEVTLTKGFYMGETEVTQEQWEAVMGSNPSASKGDYLPVENISWDDCQAFVAKLNDLDIAPRGYKFALPTEAQWEYTCRVGNDLDRSAGVNKGKNTRDVGMEQSNAWGLYDMQGNVAEWCQDWLDVYGGDVTDPVGASSGTYRAFRGGACNSDAKYCRAAFRNGNTPEFRHNLIGCRLSLTASDLEKKTNVNTVSNQTSTALTIPTSPSIDVRPLGNGSAAALKAGDKKELTIKGIKYVFRYCPAGTFTMGSPSGEKGRYDDEVQHEVTLTRGFWLGETEVTQEQWKAVMGHNPSYHNGANIHPVERVGLADCKEFIARLNGLGVAPSGYKFSLPTEAQWEYACRAGTTGPYASVLYAAAWYGEYKEYGYKQNGTHEVGTREPNAWGLYDMHGNVSEWCWDWYGDYPTRNVTDPIGASSGAGIVNRGGAWDEGARRCRSANRNFNTPESRLVNLGCRLSLTDSDFENKANEETLSNQTSTPRTIPTNPPVAVQLVENGSAATLKAGDKKELTIKGIKYVFRYCPAGTFTMGSPSDERDRDQDEVQHEVTLTKGFWLGETEVTQPQWKAVMGSNPSPFEGTNPPVEKVSWNNCQEFIAKLNGLGVAPNGYKFALPTEAQWEYACRAGTTGPRAGDLDAMAWIVSPLRGTHEVGVKEPNAWGLYDMYGNVSEWCQDWHGDYSTGRVTDPVGPASGEYRIKRGGMENHDTAKSFRSANRDRGNPQMRFFHDGFRLTLTDTGFGKKTNVESLLGQTSTQPSTTQLVTAQPVENGSAAKLKAGDKKELTMKGIKYVFRYCPAGTFTMGIGENNVAAAREVTLTKGFWLGETEVTQEQWEVVMGSKPSSFKGANLPVETIDWSDCQNFTWKLNQLGVAPRGYRFALPTEAQWEYACRAGSTTAYCFGDDWDKLERYAWFSGHKDQDDFFQSRNKASEEQARLIHEFTLANKERKEGEINTEEFYREANKAIHEREKSLFKSGITTHPVGTKEPNAWGLYDMHGNVSEWCHDWFDVYPTGNVTNPTGPSSIPSHRIHVSRGGAWWNNASDCQSAIRVRGGNAIPERMPETFYYRLPPRSNIGFRLSLVMPSH